MTMEIGTADFPAGALLIGTKKESSLCGSHQEKKVSLLDVKVAETM
jgi:hypothetical protein